MQMHYKDCRGYPTAQVEEESTCSAPVALALWAPGFRSTRLLTCTYVSPFLSPAHVYLIVYSIIPPSRTWDSVIFQVKRGCLLRAFLPLPKFSFFLMKLPLGVKFPLHSMGILFLYLELYDLYDYSPLNSARSLGIIFFQIRIAYELWLILFLITLAQPYRLTSWEGK